MLLGDQIMAAIISLDRSLMKSLHHTPILNEKLERQCRYNALFASHCMTEIHPFPREPTAIIYHNAPSEPG